MVAKCSVLPILYWQYSPFYIGIVKPRYFEAQSIMHCCTSQCSSVTSFPAQSRLHKNCSFKFSDVIQYSGSLPGVVGGSVGVVVGEVVGVVVASVVVVEVVVVLVVVVGVVVVVLGVVVGVPC